ncbi:hypothetical protein N7520_008646 [Penicillium odoratum]|uniref:uncharacterized protein n=1 Tax=Penicillium odoratum TaxID=1167516 RepID=UPI002548D720|nr:uncharacterized protein N7520_008646 [Penicillium odoratum]KAJ5751729.1 hypothetical protein N7520_008646 [Penicillium odoratum]
MTSTETNYLPTEIVVLIAEYLYDLDLYIQKDTLNTLAQALLRRQTALFNFCLVNHQCKASENLTNFIAPRVSFSLNGLASLTKCQKLVSLDLSRVGDSSITFPQLKKTVSKLGNLEDLALPIYVPLTETGSTTGSWPGKLRKMTIGGYINEQLMESFDWPTNLTDLCLSKCKNANVDLMATILENESLWGNLRNFTVESDCRFTETDLAVTGVLQNLYALERLQIPAHFARHLLLLEEYPVITIPFRDLSLTEPARDYPCDAFFSTDLLESLESGTLKGIWSLSLPSSFLSLYNLDQQKFDDVIFDHLDNIDDQELDEWGPDLGFRVWR